MRMATARTRLPAWPSLTHRVTCRQIWPGKSENLNRYINACAFQRKPIALTSGVLMPSPGVTVLQMPNWPRNPWA